MLEVNPEDSLLANQELDAHETSVTMSIIGHTHAGKSFVINNLVHGSGFGATNMSAKVADLEVFKPTSSGASHFAWDTQDPRVGRVRLVDYEGSKASKAHRPTDAGSKAAKRWDSFDKPTLKKLLTERKSLAEKILPRLAFLSSDLLVYVAKSDPSEAGPAEECSAILSDAAKQAVPHIKPTLLLVFNMQNIPTGDRRSNESICEEYLESHFDEDDLQALFSEVRGVRLPKDDHPHFEEHASIFRSTVIDMLARQKARLENSSIVIPVRYWHHLYITVAKKADLQADMPIFMTDELFKALRETSPSTSSEALALFRAALDQRGYRKSCNFEDFVRVAGGVCRITAGALALQSFDKFDALEAVQKVDDDLVRNVAPSLEKELRDVLTNRMMPLTSCSAVLSVSAEDCPEASGGRSAGDGVVHFPCTLRLDEHGTTHYNPFCRVYRGDHERPDKIGSRARRALRGIGKKINKVTKRIGLGEITFTTLEPRWDGAFMQHSTIGEQHETLKRLSKDALGVFLLQNRRSVVSISALECYNLFGRLRPEIVPHRIPGQPSVDDLPRCPVCLSGDDVSFLALSCGHSVCERCLDELRDIAVGGEQARLQVDIVASAADAKLLANLNIQDVHEPHYFSKYIGNCPVCACSTSSTSVKLSPTKACS